MRIITVFTTLILILVVTCSFNTKNINYQTECFSQEVEGYLTIKIWDTKKGIKYKSTNARKNAIHALLYSGVSGSAGCQTQAPILNTSETIRKFKLIEKKFFSRNGQWSTLTRSSTTRTTMADSLAKTKWCVYQVSVSKNELVKYLEDQKILNKLNNGF